MKPLWFFCKKIVFFGTYKYRDFFEMTPHLLIIELHWNYFA